MINKITIEPRYQETDKMGVVHHSVYPIWYEIGRVAFCEQMGFPFHKIEEAGIMQAMIEMKSTFIRPTYFGKTYILETKIASYTRVKLIFSYQLFDGDDLIHTGETLLAWLDASFKPMNLEKVHPEIYQRIVDAAKK